MAFSFHGVAGTTVANKTANQTQAVFTFAPGLDITTLAILCVAVDNNATTDIDEGAVTAVSDSKGNTWIKLQERTNGQGSAQAGATISIWYSVLTTAIASGDTATADRKSVV